MNHRNISFTKYFLAGFFALVSSVYANAQTADNSVDSAMIRVNDPRKLEIKTVRPGAKDFRYIAKWSLYCKKNNITPTNKFSYAYFDLNEYAIYLVTYEENNKITKASKRHEWNHYKDYLVGAYLTRGTVEEAYLLAVTKEIIARILSNAQEPYELKISLKQKFLEQFYKLVEDPYYCDYKDEFLLNVWNHTVSSKEDTLKYQDQLKYSTKEIINDMYIVYFGETKIDLKKYLSEKDRAKITEKIMNHPASKQIIEITKAMLGYTQMTDSLNNIFIKNYPKAVKTFE